MNMATKRSAAWVRSVQRGRLAHLATAPSRRDGRGVFPPRLLVPTLLRVCGRWRLFRSIDRAVLAWYLTRS